MLSILILFLSNRSQHVMVDRFRSQLVDVVAGSAARQCSGPIIVPSVNFRTFYHSGKYADWLCS